MPARSSYVRCHCVHCLISDPAGKQFSVMHLKSHLAGVQAQCNQATQLMEDIDVPSMHVLALTLTDNGPDISSQP
jgi:hypothetical protein